MDWSHWAVEAGIDVGQQDQGLNFSDPGRPPRAITLPGVATASGAPCTWPGSLRIKCYLRMTGRCCSTTAG
ncbi:hypothetical protein A2T76_03840 [Pseudomonas brenneri]|nr:hypothetical protein A2T76_03840 [Pseudomonas brenneri]